MEINDTTIFERFIAIRPSPKVKYLLLMYIFSQEFYLWNDEEKPTNLMNAFVVFYPPQGTRTLVKL